MDETYMKKALELAEKGKGWTAPNPLVGAVLVKNNKVIGQGYHESHGGPHAERNAIASASEEVDGATLYVNLEPCSHIGKTPPCADLLIEKNIKKVVVGMLDPNPLVAGRGIKKLKKAGIEVRTGVLEEECHQLNEVFLSFIETKRPFVLMKTAMSLDGKIATIAGDSQWISGQESRKEVHKLRHELSGIMVGVNTVLTDDPRLTARLPESKQPLRIVVDSQLRTPLSAQILQDQDYAKTILVAAHTVNEQRVRAIEALGVEVILTQAENGRVNLKELMEVLGERGVDSILLEGGATLNFSALEAGIVNKVQSYVAPKILGGKTAKTAVEGAGIRKLSQAFMLEDLAIEIVGEDIRIEGYIKKENE